MGLTQVHESQLSLCEWLVMHLGVGQWWVQYMAKTNIYVALNGAYGMINGDKCGNRQSICLATAFTVMYDVSVCVAHPNLYPQKNIIYIPFGIGMLMWVSLKQWIFMLDG